VPACRRQLYFTAGWCAPCRDFTPRLRASARALDAASGGRVEVIQVSWDHDAIGFQKYADAVGMRWLALPHAERETARALSQRFEVATIPALLVLAVSADGKSAQLVSADGRVDVERYFAAAAGGVGSAAQQAPWVRQLLNPGAR
jgi:nucleoredoxin